MEDALHRLFLDCSVRRLELSFSRIEACLGKRVVIQKYEVSPPR
jgi:hypothetical protein